MLVGKGDPNWAKFFRIPTISYVAAAGLLKKLAKRQHLWMSITMPVVSFYSSSKTFVHLSWRRARAIASRGNFDILKGIHEINFPESIASANF